jgi:hypothetical protein
MGFIILQEYLLMSEPVIRPALPIVPENIVFVCPDEYIERGATLFSQSIGKDPVSAKHGYKFSSANHVMPVNEIPPSHTQHSGSATILRKASTPILAKSPIAGLQLGLSFGHHQYRAS